MKLSLFLTLLFATALLAAPLTAEAAIVSDKGSIKCYQNTPLCNQKSATVGAFTSYATASGPTISKFRTLVKIKSQRALNSKIVLKRTVYCGRPGGAIVSYGKSRAFTKKLRKGTNAVTLDYPASVKVKCPLGLKYSHSYTSVDFYTGRSLAAFGDNYPQG